MGDKTRGLFHKFNIERTDGTSGPGGKHNGCDYFVLDLTHDKHAPAAIKAYADSCREEYPLLAADLDTKFPPAPLPSDKLRGLVRKWRADGKKHDELPYAVSQHVGAALITCADELEALLSQEPSSGAEPVAWRAWGTPWKGRDKCWVYWDEYPETIKDDPEYERFQALFASPVTGGEK